MNTQAEPIKLQTIICDIFTGLMSNKASRGKKHVDFTRRKQLFVAMLVERASELKRIINTSLKTVGIDITLKSNVNFQDLLSELKEYSKDLAYDAVSCTYTLNKSSVSIKADMSANDLLCKLKDYSQDLHDELVWLTYMPGKKPETAVLLSALQDNCKNVVHDKESSTYTINQATLSIKFARQSKLMSKINFVELQESAVKNYRALVTCLVMIKNSPDLVQAAKEQLMLYLPIMSFVAQKDKLRVFDELMNNKMHQIFLVSAAALLLNRLGISEFLIASLMIAFLLYTVTQLFANSQSKTKAHVLIEDTMVDENYKKFCEHMKYIEALEETSERYTGFYNQHNNDKPKSRVIVMPEPIKIKPFVGKKTFINELSFEKRNYWQLFEDVTAVSHKKLGLWPDLKHNKVDSDVEDFRAVV